MKNSKPWEFTSEDFDNYHCAPTLANSTGVMARIANAKLRAWIEAAPVVYGVYEDRSDAVPRYARTETIERAREFFTGAEITHRARLICIEPLVKDTAESLLREMLNDSLSDNGSIVLTSRFEDRARKLLDGGGK